MTVMLVILCTYSFQIRRHTVGRPLSDILVYENPPTKREILLSNTLSPPSTTAQKDEQRLQHFLSQGYWNEGSPSSLTQNCRHSRLQQFNPQPHHNSLAQKAEKPPALSILPPRPQLIPLAKRFIPKLLCLALKYSLYSIH